MEADYVGDWRASYYTPAGNRWDIEASLRLDKTYDWQLKPSEPQHKTQTHSGQWSFDPSESVLEFTPHKMSADDILFYERWTVHELQGFEPANTYIVARPLILGSRNLPIIFYRVHIAPTPREQPLFPRPPLST